MTKTGGAQVSAEATPTPNVSFSLGLTGSVGAKMLHSTPCPAQALSVGLSLSSKSPGFTPIVKKKRISSFGPQKKRTAEKDDRIVRQNVDESKHERSSASRRSTPGSVNLPWEGRKVFSRHNRSQVSDNSTKQDSVNNGMIAEDVPQDTQCDEKLDSEEPMVPPPDASERIPEKEAMPANISQPAEEVQKAAVKSIEDVGDLSDRQNMDEACTSIGQMASPVAELGDTSDSNKNDRPAVSKKNFMDCLGLGENSKQSSITKPTTTKATNNTTHFDPAAGSGGPAAGDVSLSQQIVGSPEVTTQKRVKKGRPKKLRKKNFILAAKEDAADGKVSDLSVSFGVRTRSGRKRKVLPLPVTPEQSEHSITDQILPANGDAVTPFETKDKEHSLKEDECLGNATAHHDSNVDQISIDRVTDGSNANISTSDGGKQINNATFIVENPTSTKPSSSQPGIMVDMPDNSSSAQNPDCSHQSLPAVKQNSKTDLQTSVESSYNESPSVSFISQKRLSHSRLNSSCASSCKPPSSKSNESSNILSLDASDMAKARIESRAIVDNSVHVPADTAVEHGVDISQSVGELIPSADLSSRVYDMTTLLSDPEDEPVHSQSFFTPPGVPSDTGVDETSKSPDSCPQTQCVPETPTLNTSGEAAASGDTDKPIDTGECEMETSPKLTDEIDMNTKLLEGPSEKPAESKSQALEAFEKEESKKLVSLDHLQKADTASNSSEEDDTVPETQSSPDTQRDAHQHDDQPDCTSTDEIYAAVPETQPSPPSDSSICEKPAKASPSDKAESSEKKNSSSPQSSPDISRDVLYNPKRGRPAKKTRTRTRSEPAKSTATTRARAKRAKSLSEPRPAPAADTSEHVCDRSTISKPRVSFADAVKYAMTPRTRGRAIVAMFDTPQTGSAVTPIKSILKTGGSTHLKESIDNVDNATQCTEMTT